MKFFWNNSQESDQTQSKIPLIAWDKICHPKCKGGLGIRRIKDVHTATSGKLGWKILTNPAMFGPK